jgi:hypothetical protein
MRMAWSPNLTNEDFPLNYDDWVLEDKIRLFEDQVLGWQLLIADDIINVHADENPHSGFAVLAMLLSYFEMIGKYLEGSTGERKPKKYFKVGLTNVFPNLKEKNEVTNILYGDARCGMYHEGLIGKRIILTRNYNTPILVVNEDFLIIAIDPHTLTTTLVKHFKGYIDQLKTSKSGSLILQNFLIRFDFIKRSKSYVQRNLILNNSLLFS